MNPELQKQLAELLAKAQDAATWAGSQLPPLVHEKIVLGRVEELVFLAFSVGLLYLGARLLRFAFPWKDDRDGECISAAIIGGVLAIVGAIFSIMSLHYALEVWFAPRIYIVEWLTGMVTK